MGIQATASLDSLSEVPELLAELDALLDRLAAADLSRCDDAELLNAARATERVLNRISYQGNRQIVAISDRGLPQAMGFRSLTTFLNVDLRVSDPTRRREQIAATATFSGIDGQPREPKYPTLAEAFAAGTVGAGHIRKTIEVLDKIPQAVPHDQQIAAEQTLADLACEHTPAELTKLGARLLDHLDPDGEVTDDNDRKRRRGITVGRQGVDKMSSLTGDLDPETRAMLDVLLAAWAKPGMNNPDDPESPGGTAEDTNHDKLKQAADRDTRSQAQRNHDALKALLRSVLEDGTLGKTHRGLPVQLIVKVDHRDLLREAGVGITAGDTVLPMTDVIALAARAQPWLAVFDGITASPMFFGRGKRFATTPQRLASFSRDDGECCSAPGCDEPATRVELHHARLDYALGGKTDITDLAPACPKHNRMVNDQPGGFTTGIRDDGPDAGRTWWQLNSAPGAPPNPQRIHRRPDIATIFDANLASTRADIHGPEPENPEPANPEPQITVFDTIRPPMSVVEAGLALRLVLGR